jgi:hypothetical protein|tara:strand:- start:1279 stop:1911 length:633 start_codon:yes stop_codon:yes gene_type:complete
MTENPDPRIVGVVKEDIKKLTRLNPSYLYLLKKLSKVAKYHKKIKWSEFVETCEGEKIKVFKGWGVTKKSDEWVKPDANNFQCLLKRAEIIEHVEKGWGLTVAKDAIDIAVPDNDISKNYFIIDQLIITYIQIIKERVKEKDEVERRRKLRRHTSPEKIRDFVQKRGVEKCKAVQTVRVRLQNLAKAGVKEGEWWVNTRVKRRIAPPVDF